MNFGELRRDYHNKICDQIIRIRKTEKGTQYPNFADCDNRASVAIAQSIVINLNYSPVYEIITEQTVGGLFEKITEEYLQNTFNLLIHLRPGKWQYSTVQTDISRFEQYEHLAYLEKIVKNDKSLSSALGGDYIIKPDIIVSRWPVTDDEINQLTNLLNKDDTIATLTPFREANQKRTHPILHASISCKWTIRSDRSQNTRTEALNLIRNRKGNLPHIVAVTAEPLPTRIAALALGTGDLDCVYHFALLELMQAIKTINNEDQLDILNSMVEGRRLRDISDLPFDLAV
jgi:hypothetical protein